MILPDDVLVIIRAYSRPLMRFSGEYKKAMIELGLSDWPEVRKKLCTPDADKMIQLLIEYKNVYLEASIRLNDMNRPSYPRLLSYNRAEHAKCIRLRNKLYVDIQRLLLGEDKYLEEQQKYRFEIYGYTFE